MKKLISLVLALALMLCAVSALAAYPEKAVECTVPWGAGGGGDLAFRAFGDVWTKVTGQPYVIKNVPGASGVTGVMEFKTTGVGDGYQMLHWSNAHTSKIHMSVVDYDVNSFKHVAQIVESANYLIVPADSPYKTLQDFVDDVLANPGMVTVANAGVGGGNHIAALLFEEAIGGEFAHITYDGGASAVTGVLAGEVNAAVCNTPEGMSNVAAGQIRILASFASKPFADYPDVPLAKDSGVKGTENLVIEQLDRNDINLDLAQNSAVNSDLVLNEEEIESIETNIESAPKDISPIQDEYIEKYLSEKELNLRATLDAKSAYKDADFVVIAAPTNYDPQQNFFDTHHIEEVIDLVLEVNPEATMVIKSTIPVGYCRSLYVKYAQRFKEQGLDSTHKFRLLFSPEFLREGKALYDNLYPSRIIVGIPRDNEHMTERAHTFAELLQEIEKIEGLERIRFMTSHPKDLSDDLIQVMKHSKKICRHLHLPPCIHPQECCPGRLQVGHSVTIRHTSPKSSRSLSETRMTQRLL